MPTFHICHGTGTVWYEVVKQVFAPVVSIEKNIMVNSFDFKHVYEMPMRNKELMVMR